MNRAFPWSWTKLGTTLVFHGSGATPRGGKDAYKAAGLPLVRSMNVYDLRFDEGALAFIDEAQAAELDRVTIEPDDVLLNITGASVARCCLAPQQVVGGRVNQHVMILRFDRSVAEPRFVARALAGPYKSKLLSIAGSGATREALTKADVENFELSLPPVEIQRAVAQTLDAYADLIKNNRRRIEILEEMARLIYREWFVHFRFPGHEDTELVESDLGPIPEGWSVEVASELIQRDTLEIGDGYRAKNSEFEDAGYAFVRVRNVRDGYLDLTGVDYLPEPYGERVGGKRGRSGDCVISMKGTVGRMAFVGERTPPLIYSPQVSYWRSLKPALISPEYLRLWMQSPDFVEQCARVKGATDMADYVNLRDQRAMRLAVPSFRVHADFVESVSPILRLSDNLRSQMQVLEEARDLLLPRLISGELDVLDHDLDLDSVA